MIYEITYPARCKDCQYLKSQRFTTKKGTISRRNIYICEKKSEQISPKSEICGKSRISFIKIKKWMN